MSSLAASAPVLPVSRFSTRLAVALGAAGLIFGGIAGGLTASGHFSKVPMLAVVLVPVLVWRRPPLAPVLLVASGLAIEQFQPTVEPTSSGPGQVVSAAVSAHIPVTAQIPLFHGIGSLHLAPADVLLFAAFVIYLVKSGDSGARPWPRSAVSATLLALGAAVALGIVVGLLHHGQFRVSLMETRPYFYVGATYVLVSVMASSREAIRTVLWAIVLVTGLKALQCLYIFATVRHMSPRPEALLGHEEAFFFSLFILLTLALWLFGLRGRLRTTATWLLPLVFAADLANNRRAAWIVLAGGVLVLAAIGYRCLPERRTVIVRCTAVALVCSAVYLPLFWNHGGGFAQPARALRSLVAPDQRDQLSDLYRIQEDANLRVNIREGGLLGRGFGVPIDYTLPITDIHSIDPFIDYIPHDGVLYILMRMGLLGGVAFWALLAAGIISGSRLARSPDRELALVGAVVACALVGYALEGAVDQGFFFYRIAFVVGALLGLAEAATRLQAAPARARFVGRRMPLPKPRVENVASLESPAPREELPEPPIKAAPVVEPAKPETSSRVGRNLAALTVGQIITWTMTLAWTLVVPRLLGPSGMGLIISAWSVTGILAITLGFGTKTYLVRAIVVDRARAPQLVGTGIVLRLVLSPLFLAGVLLYAKFAGHGHEGRLVLYLVAGATLLTLLAEPMQAAFQAIERMEYLAYSDVINKSMQGLVGIVLVVLGFGAVGFAGCWMVMSGVVIVLDALWLRRYLPIDLRTGIQQLVHMAKESVAYWAFGLFFMIYLWIDATILSLMTSPEVVGWYGVPTKIFQTLMFVPVLMSTAWLPRLVAAFERDPQELRRAARTPIELALLIGLPLAAAVAVAAQPMVHLFYGPAYAEAVPVLVILGLCIPLMYLNIMFNQLLIAAKRQLVWTYVMAGATVFNPAVNVLLIPMTQHRFGNGAIGAALSLFVTELVILAAGIVIVGRGVFEQRMGRRCALVAGASAAAWAVAFATREFGAIPSLVAAAVTFVTLAFALRLLTSEEIAFLRAQVRRATAWRRTLPRLNRRQPRANASAEPH